MLVDHHRRQSPATPNTIRLNMDLSKLGVVMSAAAAAADGDVVELITSAAEVLAGAIVLLATDHWG